MWATAGRQQQSGQCSKHGSLWCLHYRYGHPRPSCKQTKGRSRFVSPVSISWANLTQHRRSRRTKSLGFLLPALPSLPARLKWLHSPAGLDRPCCPHSYPRRHRRCPLLGPPYERHRIYSGVQSIPLSPLHLAPAIYHAPANMMHRSSKMERWHPSSCVTTF